MTKFFEIPNLSTSSILAGCFTTNSTDSPMQVAPCLLQDWIYEKDMKVYKGCSNPGTFFGSAICPTKLENGIFLSDSEHWGYCNENCTVIDGGLDGEFADTFITQVMIYNLGYNI